MPELPEHEARYIRDHVNSQSNDDEAGLVQKVGARRVMGRVHDMYDVHCERSRWWVITDPTNLYLQDDFPEVEQALIFHLGLGVFMAERSRAELPGAEEERVSGAWRRFKQALTDMNVAGESEDFQAVGIKCRDSLLAVVRDHMAAEWVGEVAEPPNVGDFKFWGNIFAERLAEGRVRSYIKALVDKAWDLSVWLQHNTNATPDDAELVLDATAHLPSALGRLIHRRDHGEPERCLRCGSYRLDEDVELVDGPKSGMFVSTICGGCGWQPEQAFTSLVNHFAGNEQAAIDYLSRPADGPSDRLDIRDSSTLPGIYDRPALAKLYRAFISEMVSVMNGSTKAREITFVGDCAWGVFNTPSKSDIDAVFSMAAQTNSLMKVLMSAHALPTRSQAAERFGLRVDELTGLIEAGEGPAYIEIRRMVRFLARDLEEWAGEWASQRTGAINRPCGGCRADPGEACYLGCSSYWT